ncbi:hypothetical protein B0H19DRAFT_1083658 [Mycena capillaripes]|nr:hypothetical protein B0H19DRAFT_1083658 [Mycena capillaripes]
MAQELSYGCYAQTLLDYATPRDSCIRPRQAGYTERRHPAMFSQEHILARAAVAVGGTLEESTLNGDNGDSENGNDREELHFRHGVKEDDTEKNYLASFRPAFYVFCALRMTVIMLRMAVIMPDTVGKAIH